MSAAQIGRPQARRHRDHRATTASCRERRRAPRQPPQAASRRAAATLRHPATSLSPQGSATADMPPANRYGPPAAAAATSRKSPPVGGDEDAGPPIAAERCLGTSAAAQPRGRGLSAPDQPPRADDSEGQQATEVGDSKVSTSGSPQEGHRPPGSQAPTTKTPGPHTADGASSVGAPTQPIRHGDGKVSLHPDAAYMAGTSDDARPAASRWQHPARILVAVDRAWRRPSVVPPQCSVHYQPLRSAGTRTQARGSPQSDVPGRRRQHSPAAAGLAPPTSRHGPTSAKASKPRKPATARPVRPAALSRATGRRAVSRQQAKTPGPQTADGAPSVGAPTRAACTAGTSDDVRPAASRWQHPAQILGNSRPGMATAECRAAPTQRA